MRIQTLSILTGTAACDAKCPFCVSKMTHSGGMCNKPQEINWRNLGVACKLAERAGVTTAMLTGKGEPTLWPDQIDKYLLALDRRFPFIELQTNGMRIANGDIDIETLKYWRMRGLTTVAISVAHWYEEINQRIYLGSSRRKYPPLKDFVDAIHGAGLSMRLNCVLLKNYISTPENIEDLIRMIRPQDIEQLTLIPVGKPSIKVKKTCADVYGWTAEHGLDDSDVAMLKKYLDRVGTQVLQLAHGAMVYDVDGQNVCLSNCLKKDRYEKMSVMRNLIFYPDGHLRYDWEHSGAILL